MSDQESDQGLTWQLRVSRQARYARLRIKPFGGLEVVIPHRFPRHRVAELVAEHADWAREQLDRQARLRAAVRLPTEMALAFDDSIVAIRYPASSGFNEPSQGELFEQATGGSIEVHATEQKSAIRELRRWLRRRAQRLLPPLLGEVSASTGLDFRSVSIRSQKTRWGSCSSSGSISLNDQLLFLPRETVIYLMVHELCHRRHMNHSQAFWRLVASHYPDYRRQESLLSQPQGLVPQWFLLDLYD